MRVLNIEVSKGQLNRWIGWFAPAVQPFLTDAELADFAGERTDVAVLADEVRDTYGLYGVPGHLRYLWLSEAQFMGLSRPCRASLVRAQRTFGRKLVPSVRPWDSVVGDELRIQADGHRFVWWPSLLNGCAARVLEDFIEEGHRASRHDEVPEHVWNSLTRRLPGARGMAGTFPAASGPNCFGTVMAAAGVAGADTVWMQRAPFECWLSQNTRRGGHDSEGGTVIVWRSPDGLAQHAAVTLGEGWVLHKPSQGWMSPRKVLTTAECKAASRSSGRRLERYTIQA